MKKILSILLVVVIILSGCGSNSGETELSLWTFNELHTVVYETMADSWNKEHPDNQVKLDISVLPYEDLHNKLLVCAQSGNGCPDIADVEVKRFPLFIEGDNVPFVDLSSYVKDSPDELVQSRFDLYSKDSKNYGLPFHVGANVMYYNDDLMDEAGVDPSQIKTWDDYVDAAYTVTEKTGVPMTVVETKENLVTWGPLVQAGADITNEEGTPNINDPDAVEFYTQIQKMIDDGVVGIAAGGFVHSEDFYGSFNSEQAASLPMPLWYLNRFTDYMPDLAGKISIYQSPVNDKNPDISTVGIGGTGTVVMKSSKNSELAADYLAYTKLSKEGNILMWNELGFDPVNASVWDELETPETFSSYFTTDPLEVLRQYDPNEINSPVSQPITVDVIIELSTNTYNKLFEKVADVQKTVDASQKAVEGDQ